MCKTSNSDRLPTIDVLEPPSIDIPLAMASSRDGETDKRVRKTSIAWSYFTLVDEENYVASCNTCDAQISFRSSISNLMKHVRRKHSDLETRMSDEEKDSESEAEETNKLNLSGDEDKLQASLVWEHFEVTSADKKIATCSVCRVPLSYKSSIKALLKHLHRKHNIGQDVEVLLSDDEEKTPAEPLEQTPASFRSAVWPYFRVTDAAGKAARCLVCKKLLSYNTGTSNLRKHLVRKHPLIKLPAPGEERKTIILSSGDQLYEFEATKGENDEDETDAQDEPVAIDEIFLDEFNGSINRIEKESKPKSRKRKHKQKLVLEPSDSDDEVVLKKKYAKKELDSIDLFARYLASLLKELPKQASNRLQKEFVRQVMSAQTESSNNAYSITLTNESVYVPDDVRFEVIAKEEAAGKVAGQNVFK